MTRLLSILVVSAGLLLPATGAAQTKTAAATPDPKAVKSTADAVATMIKTGLIKRYDLKTGKFYIDQSIWQGFQVWDKKQIVKVISKHRDFTQGLPQVTLYESKNGKELANYGPILGVTIR